MSRPAPEPCCAPRRLLTGCTIAAVLTMLTQGTNAQNDQWNRVVSQPTSLGQALPALKETMATITAGSDDREARSIERLAWTMLSLSANGSSLRHGPHRQHLKLVTIQLRQLRDPVTGVRTSAPERARHEQLLAAFAFSLTCVTSQYKLLNKEVRGTVDAAARTFEREGAPAASAREVALLVMTVASLDERFADEQERLLAIAEREVARLPKGRDRFTDAVRHLVELERGEQVPLDLTAALCWPGDLEADPLHAWVGAFAMRDAPEKLRAQHHLAARGLLATRAGDHLWPARDGSTPEDRIVRAAMLSGVLGMTAPQPAPGKQADGELGR